MFGRRLLWLYAIVALVFEPVAADTEVDWPVYLGDKHNSH